MTSSKQQVINPSTGEKIGEVSEASPKDVDRAVDAAQKAYDTVWGLNTTGRQRGELMIKLAEAIEANIDEIAAIEVGSCCLLYALYCKLLTFDDFPALFLCLPPMSLAANQWSPQSLCRAAKYPPPTPKIRANIRHKNYGHLGIACFYEYSMNCSLSDNIVRRQW